MDTLENFFNNIHTALKEVRLNEFINSEEHDMITDMYYDHKTVAEVVSFLTRYRNK